MNDAPENTRPGLPPEIAQRMQAIIERHARQYREDLPGLIGRMQALAGQAADPAAWREAAPTLRREAHDMKGQAATFGLPALSTVSHSLCRLLEHGKLEHPDYAITISRHVGALGQLMLADDPALVDSLRAASSKVIGRPV